MKRASQIAGAIACLTLSTGAAALDLEREQFSAPGLRIGVTFGGTAPAKITVPGFAERTAPVYATPEGGISTATWVVIGIVAVVIVVAASNSGGGGGGGY